MYLNSNVLSHKSEKPESLTLFFPFLETKHKFSASWWSGNKKYFCFLFIASPALLKPYQIQQTFIKEFSYMLLLFIL